MKKYISVIFASIVCCLTAISATIYNSGGFSQPRFEPGPVAGQDSAHGTWSAPISGSSPYTKIQSEGLLWLRNKTGEPNASDRRVMARHTTTDSVTGNHWVEFWYVPPVASEIHNNFVFRIRDASNTISFSIQLTATGISGRSGYSSVPDSWNRLTVYVDLVNSKYDIYLNGDIHASGTEVAFSNIVSSARLYEFDWTAKVDASPAGGILIDDFRISTSNPLQGVPLPSEVIYSSNSFDSPSFILGPIAGQDASNGTWTAPISQNAAYAVVQGDMFFRLQNRVGDPNHSARRVLGRYVTPVPVSGEHWVDFWYVPPVASEIHNNFVFRVRDASNVIAFSIQMNASGVSSRSGYASIPDSWNRLTVFVDPVNSNYDIYLNQEIFASGTDVAFINTVSSASFYEFDWTAKEDASPEGGISIDELQILTTNPLNTMVVYNEQSMSALVLPENAPDYLWAAAEDFVQIIERATGVTVPIVEEDQEFSLGINIARIYVGACQQTLAIGLSPANLPLETYRIVSHEGNLYIIGNDSGATSSNLLSKSSYPTRWAFNHLLETYLSVRWLWPGELGTYVPPADSFLIPEIDRTHQPELEIRRLRVWISTLSVDGVLPQLNANEIQAEEEAYLWLAAHQSGRRGGLQFGHAFGSWWDNYSAQNPNFFAEAPAGVDQPFPRSDWVKLRLSNPDVIDQIVYEYIQAGAPKYYNVCPNDGGGFDLSAATLAWDIPANQDLDDIWRSRANLTARYVKFWNLLYAELSQINPDVELCSYAYSAYRFPPPVERPLTAKMVMGFVGGFHEGGRQQWEGWANTGSDMFLRPNWWHVGGGAPYLPLEDSADFMDLARSSGMIAFDMDTILGNWATQGVYYYMMARLMNHPDLTTEDIIEEYTSAFGAGAQKIRDFIAYWENETDLNGYPLPVGGAESVDPDGRYEALVNQGKIQLNPVGGSHRALPYLYTDATLQPAYQLLDEAETLIGSSDPDALARVEFLRDGLDAMKATRDLVQISEEYRVNPSPALLDVFQQAADDLETYRATLTLRHVIWGEFYTRYEDRYRLPIRPRNLDLEELDEDGA